MGPSWLPGGWLVAASVVVAAVALWGNSSVHIIQLANSKGKIFHTSLSPKSSSNVYLKVTRIVFLFIL